MPRISLIVCLRHERDLLARLLEHADGCYDDLVVVHDGRAQDDRSPPPIDRPLAEMALNYEAPDPAARVPPFYLTPPASSASMHELVLRYGGQYFEGPRCYQQEPHWPFAWAQSRNDWILRLDADEFPSGELRQWLRDFRAEPDPAPSISGYTCIWPLWNGRKAATGPWPGGRHFLFHRQRVRFFGMVEQVPVPETAWEPLPLVLHHQPNGKSYGIRNILVRRQAYRWRQVIAQSLMGKPTDLPRWRWTAGEWPEPWRSIRRHPLRHGFSAIVRYPLRQFISMRKAGLAPNPSAAFNPGLHHFMLGLRVYDERRRNPMTAP